MSQQAHLCEVVLPSVLCGHRLFMTLLARTSHPRGQRERCSGALSLQATAGIYPEVSLRAQSALLNGIDILPQPRQQSCLRSALCPVEGCLQRVSLSLQRENKVEHVEKHLVCKRRARCATDTHSAQKNGGRIQSCA